LIVLSTSLKEESVVVEVVVDEVTGLSVVAKALAVAAVIRLAGSRVGCTLAWHIIARLKVELQGPA